jgi:hypothetical protein
MAFLALCIEPVRERDGRDPLISALLLDRSGAFYVLAVRASAIDPSAGWMRNIGRANQRVSQHIGKSTRTGFLYTKFEPKTPPAMEH